MCRCMKFMAYGWTVLLVHGFWLAHWKTDIHLFIWFKRTKIFGFELLVTITLCILFCGVALVQAHTTWTWYGNTIQSNDLRPKVFEFDMQCVLLLLDNSLRWLPLESSSLMSFIVLFNCVLIWLWIFICLDREHFRLTPFLYNWYKSTNDWRNVLVNAITLKTKAVLHAFGLTATQKLCARFR